MFSLEQCTLNLNGVDITGWSDDTDALSFPNVDIATSKRGADGKKVTSSTGEKGGPVVIKLLANGKSTKFLMNAVTAQLNGSAVSWNGFFRDPVNGVTVAMTNGTLQNVHLVRPWVRVMFLTGNSPLTLNLLYLITQAQTFNQPTISPPLIMGVGSHLIVKE